MATLFVGDIHGCAESFRALLEALGFRRGRDRLLLTGDILTRGPDPAGVWDTVRATGAEMVMGNHDRYLLRQLERLEAGEPPAAARPEKLDDVARVVPFAATLVPWLRARPYVIDDPRFLLVHAGIHPVLGLAGTTEDELIHIRTWPPTDGIVGPRWHDHVAPLPDRPIVFGHDAPGGLVVKRRADGTPWLIGLDSGCVYGGMLSGWILEEARLVQVPGPRPVLASAGDRR